MIPYHNSFYAMGTRLNLVFMYNDLAVCERVFKLIENEVLRIELLLSYFNELSEVYKINHSKTVEPQFINDELLDILLTCDRYYRLTNGAFDIAIRALIEANEYSPAEKQDGVLLQSYHDYLEIDEHKKTILLKNDKVKIDFGGIGKGYALEKINRYLIDSPIESAFISFGESTILVKGLHPGGKNWSVGMKNIFNSESPIHNFDLPGNYSISISSNYYVDDAGEIKRKKNVINPFTQKYVEEATAIGVKSISPIQAEILSTAFLVMDDQHIFDVLKNLENVETVKVIYSANQPLVKVYR